MIGQVEKNSFVLPKVINHLDVASYQPRGTVYRYSFTPNFNPFSPPLYQTQARAVIRQPLVVSEVAE